MAPCLMCLACTVFTEIEKIVFVTPAPEASNAYGFRNSGVIEMAKKSLTRLKLKGLRLMDKRQPIKVYVAGKLRKSMAK